MEQKKILLLTANPKDTLRLRLDEEVREIKNGLQLSSQRDKFVVEEQWAVRHQEFRRAVLDFRPNIVHFSGHGEGEVGIVLEDDDGKAHFVKAEALAGFFKLFAEHVECVLLNACYSEIQADAIAKHINYVIGMNKAVGDKAAREFAVAFYDALGAGRTVEFAYGLACNAIQMAGIPEHLTPVLLTKKESPGEESEKQSPVETSGEAVNVFISYRHQEPDSNLAHVCADALKTQRHRVFIDTDIGWGADWVKRIRNELEQTEFLLLLLSHDAAQSEMVVEEVTIAKELARQKKGFPIILPVRIQYPFSDTLPYRLAMELHNIHQISWSGEADTPDLIARLLTTIANRSGWPLETAETPIAAGRSQQITPLSQFDPRNLIRPGEVLDTESSFYIRRKVDDEVLNEIKRTRGIVTLKGARQTGKTSLMMRIYASVRRDWQIRAAFIDFQALSEHFESLNTIWCAIALRIAEQLGLDDWDETHWNPKASHTRNFSRFLKGRVFDSEKTPLLLCLDKVDYVFESQIKTKFFASVRSFYNSGAYEPVWKNVRWILATSSEPQFFIEDITQSPFNIGLRVDLKPFTPKEIVEVAQHCGFTLESEMLKQVVAYVGGHPYLVHLLMYHLARDPLSQQELFDAQAASHGIFRDHLHRFLFHFQKESELASAMKSVIEGNCCKDAKLRSRLEAAGLIGWKEDDQVVPLCDLYAEFFGREL